MVIPSINDPKNPADNIYNEVAENCDFFRDQNGDIYLVSSNDIAYDLKYLSSTASVCMFLRKLYFNQYGRTSKNADIQSAFETIMANTHDCPDEIPVYKRVGQNKNIIYYDLLDPSRSVVKISKKGVEIIASSDIKGMFFSIDNNMCEQQLKIENSSYSLLDFISDFFKVEENQKLLLAVYIYTAFIPKIKHPILIVEGEKGACKSTLLEKIWQIVNPVKKDLFSLPYNKDGLITLLSNNYFCPIDNIGKISDEFSNVLCQASTGGNLTKRKLFTDNEEFSINIKRIVALNGIDLGITQSDLLDRAILINLKRLEDSERLPMEIVDTHFQKRLPSIMANIFSTLSKALSIYSNITLTEYPRMADFCRYGYAIAEAIKEGFGEKFIDEYSQNIDFASEKAIEQSPLLLSIRDLIDKQNYWKGSATELLKKLNSCLREVHIGNTFQNLLPDTPNALSRTLSKHSHEFKKAGISIKIARSKDRYIEITKVSPNAPTISTMSSTKNDSNTQNRKNLLADYD